MTPSDDQKKATEGISLDELADAGVESESKAHIEAFKLKKKMEKKLAEDPRAQTLAKLSQEEKLMMMSRQYEFDRKEPRFELLLLCLLPVALKYLKVFPAIAEMLEKNSGVEQMMVILMLKIVLMAATIFKFAELISAGLIFLFPPLQATRQRFLVTFEGLDLPVKLRVKPGHPYDRVKVNWSQIGEVVPAKSGPYKGLEIRNFSHQCIGEMRWDLWDKDKRVLLKLLTRYVGDKHPLRVYIERELGREE